MGYVREAEDGWALDPDTQVRERLRYVFSSFRRHGVVRAVVRDLKEQGLELAHAGLTAPRKAMARWSGKRPRSGAVIRILHNPAYAGAYVYGRWEYSGERRSPKTGKAISACPFHGTMAGEDHASIMRPTSAGRNS